LEQKGLYSGWAGLPQIGHLPDEARGLFSLAAFMSRLLSLHFGNVVTCVPSRKTEMTLGKRTQAASSQLNRTG
jgi:hypothetical protein